MMDYDAMTKEELITEIMFLKGIIRKDRLPRFKRWLQYGHVTKKKLKEYGATQEQIDNFPRPIK
jgi:hypothetical protein